MFYNRSPPFCAVPRRERRREPERGAERWRERGSKAKRRGRDGGDWSSGAAAR